MTKSNPFFLLVATICLLLVAMIAFWIALLPQRMLGQVTARMAQEQGTTFEARSPKLRFDGGLILRLETVSASAANASGNGGMTARAMDLHLGMTNLFGGAGAVNSVVLTGPVLDVDISKPAAALLLPAPSVFIRDGVVRLRDAGRKSVIALSDVNGRIISDGGLKLDVSFIKDNALTTLLAETESAERFLDGGSPVDITVLAKDRSVAFSGRAQFAGALKLDGQVTIEGGDTGEMLAWAGMPLHVFKNAGPFSLAAGVSTDGLSAKLNTVSGKIGTTGIAGKVIVEAGADRLRLTGDVTIETLSLLQNIPLLAGPWREAPFAVADLSAIDANVKIKTQHLTLRQQDWGPADIVLTSTDGQTKIAASMPSATVNLALSPKKTTVTLDTAIEAKSMDAKSLLGGLFGFSNVSGPADLFVKATSNGTSVAAHVSTLKGTFAFVARKVNVNGANLAALLKVPQKGWATDTAARTADVGLALAARFEEGVATMEKADISLGGTTTSLRGEVDLLRQAFNLTLRPKGKVAAVTGTWVLPVFAADAGAASAN